MEDVYEVMQRLERQQHASDMQWTRHIVCVGLDVVPTEEDGADLREGRHYCVNHWTKYSFQKEVARQTGDIRRIDPVTGVCTEIVHHRKAVGQRSKTKTAQSTPEKGQVRE